ncbi:hypothetical protein [Methylobacterium radiotolerans]|uniref:hypothetical protein n=1 Tax=Methylobacterium radiotolerans TaxID=31998 RepID=UPI0015F6F794|nr:hypothetical protein [Methylobacterium radiotolerans]
MDTTETKPARTKRTPEQIRAAALATVARANDAIRRRDTREKVIVGAMVIRRAFKGPGNAAKLLAMIDDEDLRGSDLDALHDLLYRLHLAAHPAVPVEPSAEAGPEGE